MPSTLVPEIRAEYRGVPSRVAQLPARAELQAVDRLVSRASIGAIFVLNWASSAAGSGSAGGDVTVMKRVAVLSADARNS